MPFREDSSPERGEGRGGKRPRRGAEGTARATEKMAETTPAPPVFAVRPETDPISPARHRRVPTPRKYSKCHLRTRTTQPSQCGDKLAVDAYLKSVIEPLPTTVGTPSHGPLSGGGVDEPFAAAAPILTRLLDAEDALLERRESIARRAARLASAVRDEERVGPSATFLRRFRRFFTGSLSFLSEMSPRLKRSFWLRLMRSIRMSSSSFGPSSSSSSGGFASLEKNARKPEKSTTRLPFPQKNLSEKSV